MPDTIRPVPVPNEDTLPYWEAARRHELQLPYCGACARFSAPGSLFCDTCGQPPSEWRQVRGDGVLWSFCVTCIEVVAGYEPPYVVGVVELDDAPGVRLVANVVDCRPDEVAIGMRVSLVFEDRGDVSLPQFRPAPDGAAS